jgi:hypothetical protein
MFSCTPMNGIAFINACKAANYSEAAKSLNNIISLRDTFAKYSIFPSFSAAMNELGFEGEFGPDFCGNVNDQARIAIRDELCSIGEL